MRLLFLCLFLIDILSSYAISQKFSRERLEILAVGDIMLGRGVARKIELFGPEYLLAKLPLPRTSDWLLIGNLESPLSHADFISTSPYRFKGDPDIAGSALPFRGIRCFSLANNHALDCGPEGLSQTRSVLDSLGIYYSGISAQEKLTGKTNGSNIVPSISLPAVIKIGQNHVGFLAFGEPYLLEGFSVENLGMLAPADSCTIVNSIAAIRDSCSLIIVSFHWGYEYWDHPSRKQKYLARLAIRSGAKIVHGHHPHVLQGVEFYRGGIIAYSLGNFIFDQRDTAANRSAVLHLVLKGTDIDSVWLQPIEIKEKRPVPMEKEFLHDYALIIKELCQKLGTRTKVSDDLVYLYR